jgi:heme exporter protein B
MKTVKTPFLQVASRIAVKDLRLELRSRELLGAMGVFALLSVLIFSFALELDRAAREEAISGVLWVTVAFAAILGMNRSLAQERDQGSIEAILVAPIDRTAIFVGKLAGNFLFALVIGLVLIPLMVVLYNLPPVSGWLFVTLLLGVLGLTGVGTLLAAMTVQSRSRETLLPIIMLPMALPVVLAAVRSSTGILAAAPADQWGAWLQFLVAVDVIYFAACLLLFEYVVEE